MIHQHTFVGTLMYIACLCPNLFSIQSIYYTSNFLYYLLVYQVVNPQACCIQSNNHTFNTCTLAFLLHIKLCWLANIPNGPACYNLLTVNVHVLSFLLTNFSSTISVVEFCLNGFCHYSLFIISSLTTSHLFICILHC